MSLVSVIVPTYNRPLTLARALYSIQQQSYKFFEIIVVNDAGEDVAHLCKAKNIRYLVHEENKGLGSARNTGLRAARSKYVAYLDDDDIWLPNHLDLCLRHLETIPHVRVVYTDCYNWWNEERHIMRAPSHRYDADIGETVEKATIICMVHERACLDKAGYFEEGRRHLEDWDFIIRLTRACPTMHIKTPTACYSRRGKGQLSTDKREMTEARQTILERYKKELIERHGRKETD